MSVKNFWQQMSKKIKTTLMYLTSSMLVLGSVGFAAPELFGQIVYAIDANSSPVYNGHVEGFVSASGLSVTGSTTGDFETTLSGNLTEYSNPTQKVSFAGVISGDINGDIAGGVNYNGFDTLFAEVTGSGASGYVYLIGEFSGPTGHFEGRFVTQSDPINFITSIAISGGPTVQLNSTLQMRAVTSPVEASDDVAWSVWTGTDDSYGSATIDKSTGLLTATGVGKVIVIASALDGSLVTQNYLVTVIPDSTKPMVSVVSPNMNQPFADAVPISISASDASGIASVSMHIYDVATNSLVAGCTSIPTIFDGTNWNVTINNGGRCKLAPNGVYMIRAWAYDNFNNVNFASSVNFVKEKIRPMVSVVSPNMNQPFADAVPISISASDASGIASVSMHIYDVATNSLVAGCTSIPTIFDGTNWNVTINNGGRCNLPTEGYYRIAAWAYDNAGNPGWALRHDFIFDDAGPKIQDASLSDVAINLSDSSPTFKSTLNDSLSIIYSAEYRIEDLSKTVIIGWTPLSAEDGDFDSKTETINSVIDTSKLKDGEYKLKLRTYDKVKNKRAVKLQFRVDKTPPKIVYTDINSDDNLFTPILTVDGYYTFNWVESSKNPIGATFDGSLLTPVFSVMNDGTYVFTLNASDEFENKSSYNFTFTYKAPDVVYTPPTDDGEVLGDADIKDENSPEERGDQDGEIKGESDVKEDDEQNGFLGLEWYWWLLLFAVLGGGGWWFIAGWKKRKEAE